MTPLATVFLLIGLVIGAVVVAHVLTAGDGTWVTKRPAERITPALKEQMRRGVIVAGAFRKARDHKVRAGYQKGNHS